MTCDRGRPYLLFKHDPMASNAALVQKFSEAINSSPDFCLCFSALIIALISGSSCSKGSVPKKNDLAAPPDNLKDWPANLVKELNLEGNMAADVMTVWLFLMIVPTSWRNWFKPDFSSGRR